MAGLAFTASMAHAQEMTAFAGGMRGGGDGSYAWGFGYTQGLGDYFAASFTWLNEGHVPNHHRDGYGLQLWARWPVLQRRLVFAAGIGPYRYYDTVAANQGASYDDDHGWGMLYSLSATYYTDSRWLFSARLNRVQAPGSINTTSFLLGVGYQLERPTVPGPLAGFRMTGAGTGNELTVFLGDSVVNSLDSENAMAEAVEYRRGLSGDFDWTLSYINEGSTSSGGRHGVATQVWLKHDFFQDRLSLGVGVGPYFARDQYHSIAAGTDDRHVIAGLLTMSAAYRFAGPWVARFSWNRVVTGYDRDSDIFLFGVGYRF